MNTLLWVAVTASRLEEIAAWCQLAPELEPERRSAWRQFFAEDDPRPVRYWPGAGDQTSKMRRFLGWFMFDHQGTAGQRPAALAARALYDGSAQEEAVRAVEGARFVLAIVASVMSGRSLLLEIERERFEIRDRRLSRSFTAGLSVVAHLVPTGRRGEWLVGPGWLEWPFQLGPNMRKDLHKLQMDPLTLERVLQSRASEEAERRPAPPQDTSLEDAVARMTAAAHAVGRIPLVMRPAEWSALVVKHMATTDLNAFTQEIFDRAGAAESIEELDRWLQLAMNIWNNTPQPDRGGKTAHELVREARRE